ncbi:hypothetical protein Cgig2_024099 [Carnegiea gigantea]|uniref:Uncharacterized protein n=1 Tax=Carnegiea gigantea TaxID=171969 RepID=A0A9Q1GUH7_9CARY|nr:hypothetical protein Cgig2_024099 [Carnegiea gigantea]
MFRSRVTLEEYLKSIQHEDAAGEDVSLDDIDMIPDLEEEEEVETAGENIFESRVSINMNPSLITIPDDFKDDKEDITVNIVKRKMGASEVVFSEATVPVETFAHRKLMGPESSGRVRGVGSGVTSNQLNTKHNRQSGTKTSDSSIVCLLLKEGDDVEENQRTNTPLAGQIETFTVLRDKGGAAHTSRSPHILNQLDNQNTSMGENTNISGCSKQLNIARRLNFDQREQVRYLVISIFTRQIPQSNVTI